MTTNEFLLSIQKHTNMLVEQAKTKAQETLEFRMNKQIETFSLIRQLIFLKQENGS